MLSAYFLVPIRMGGCCGKSSIVSDDYRPLDSNTNERSSFRLPNDSAGAQVQAGSRSNGSRIETPNEMVRHRITSPKSRENEINTGQNRIKEERTRREQTTKKKGIKSKKGNEKLTETHENIIAGKLSKCKPKEKIKVREEAQKSVGIRLKEELEPLIENQEKKHITEPKQIHRNDEILGELMRIISDKPKPVPPEKRAYSLEVLDTDSTRYQLVISLFQNEKFNHCYKITSIAHVWNPYTYTQYKLNKLKNEQADEKLLFHGTSYENLNSILKTNFDWRKCKNGICGWGISFSNNPWYASQYSTNRSIDGKNYVMILANVLVGRISYGNGTTRVPMRTCDTTMNIDGQVFAKYDDGCFYPRCLIYFEKSVHHQHKNEPNSLG